MPNPKLTLKPAQVNYTHSVDIFALPKNIQRLIREGGNEENLGTQYNYMDGDYYVVPDFCNTEFVNMTDEQLTIIVENEDDDAFEELFANHVSQLLEQVGSNRVIQVLEEDEWRQRAAVEVARRFILAQIPHADRIMAERNLAIYVWH